MLSSISWHDLIITIVSLVILYYIIVLALFFRKDVVEIVKNGSWRKRKAQSITKEPELFAGINELLEDLKAVFHTSLARTYQKEELMQALKSTLHNHRGLKGTEFEAAVNQHIIHTAESTCAISLDESDIRRLW